MWLGAEKDVDLSSSCVCVCVDSDLAICGIPSIDELSDDCEDGSGSGENRET